MHLQELEDIDYNIGAASEYQNAFAVSLMERQPDDSEKIETLVKQGKFVLFRIVEVCCPRTDALMGNDRHYISHHDTREEAIAAAENDGDDLEYLGILPYPTPEPTPVSIVSNDEIPF